MVLLKFYLKKMHIYWAYNTNKMSSHDDQDSVTEKVDEFVNKIKGETRDAEVDIKDVQENA
jgi:hypothetical protein